MNINDLPAAAIQAILDTIPNGASANHFPPEMLSGPPRTAAVLIALAPINGDWHLLFIRRTEIEGDMHSGQVAFPGGARESQDLSIIQTALREANEEIGLDPKDVQILGQMNGFITISNYEVIPIVGVIPWPYEFNISKNEVSKVFTIPLSWLNDTDNWKEISRELPNDQEVSVIYYNQYEGEILWGATARFTLSFLDMIKK